MRTTLVRLHVHGSALAGVMWYPTHADTYGHLHTNIHAHTLTHMRRCSLPPLLSTLTSCTRSLLLLLPPPLPHPPPPPGLLLSLPPCCLQHLPSSATMCLTVMQACAAEQCWGSGLHTLAHSGRRCRSCWCRWCACRGRQGGVHCCLWHQDQPLLALEQPALRPSVPWLRTVRWGSLSIFG